MIELEKSDYHILKTLCPDNHRYVEIPMIINGMRGRVWADNKTNPEIALISIGDMVFIEGRSDCEQLVNSLNSIKDRN